MSSGTALHTRDGVEVSRMDPTRHYSYNALFNKVNKWRDITTSILPFAWVAFMHFLLLVSADGLDDTEKSTLTRLL